jgi:hypothetical protein
MLERTHGIRIEYRHGSVGIDRLTTGTVGS